MKLTRRDILAAGIAASAASIAGMPAIAFAKEGDMIELLKLMAPAGIPDKVIGNADAKVTLIEYASPTCPHCAAWANDVLGPFRAKYVETGKVKLIIRPFARNTLDAAIFMLAEHAARAIDAQTGAADPSAPSGEPDPATPVTFSAAAIETYENVLATFFRTQAEWGIASDPLPAIKKVTTQLGFSDEAFEAALKDQELFAAIEAMRDQALDEFGLEGTPSFYLNGKQLTGDKTLDELSAEIDPLLG